MWGDAIKGVNFVPLAYYLRLKEEKQELEYLNDELNDENKKLKEENQKLKAKLEEYKNLPF